MISSPIGRGEQDHDPVDLEAAHQPPHVAVEVGEEQRREVPDRLFRANLAETAAGEAASDREREGDPFARDDRGDAEDRSDDRPRVRAGQEPGEECARERQVGRVVIDEEARDDARRQGYAKGGRKNQPLGPVTLFSQQDAAEPREPHQHRRKRGHDRDLHDERREQRLPGRQRSRSLGHPGSIIAAQGSRLKA